jgi:hypothetical protein
MNNTAIIIIVVVFGLFLFIVLANTIVYAQQMSPPSSTSPQIPVQSSSSPKLHAVKIISPIKGQQIPVGKDLTIAGTSIDNATSNCQVSMSINRVKPYQPATAAGTGGANDYSKWNFVLTPNYTTIKPGPDNRITAKYTCTDNPVMVSPTYSSVNVTGVMDATSTTTTSTTIPTANVLQQKQQTMTTSNNATTISNGNPNKITPQDKPSLSVVNNNTTPVGNSVSTPPAPPVSTPTNTLNSGKLLYLGINSKSANKVDDNTKSAVAHHSSNDDNSFKPTTKIKTQHTSSSSDKSTKKTTTIANNIAEEHHSKNPSTSKTKTSHSSDKSINSDKSKKTTSNTATTTATAEEHHSKNPSTSKTKNSDSSDKSNDGGGAGGGVIDSEFGHSDPLSDALDAMSNTLDHLFG